MAERLMLDTVALQAAGAALRVVACEFAEANARSDDVAGAVGHAGLAACLTEFAHGWDDRRSGLIGSIEGLADACSGIGGAFEALDTDFAAALRGDR